MKKMMLLFMLVVALTASVASSARAQSSVDLRLWSYGFGGILNGQVFPALRFYVFIEPKKAATGTKLTVEIPEGVGVVSMRTDRGECSFSGNLVTCDLGVVGREGFTAIDWVAGIEILVQSNVSASYAFTGTVSANEPDPNPADNTGTIVATLQATPAPKSRKRVRFF